MPQQVNASDDLDVRLVVTHFPYKWRLFEADSSGALNEIASGSHELKHRIGKVAVGTTRTLVWSFVVVSQDPDTTVLVRGEALAGSKSIAHLDAQLVVTKPTTSRSFQLELTGV